MQRKIIMRLPDKPISRAKLQLNVEQQKKLLKISPLFDVIIDDDGTNYSLTVYEGSNPVEQIKSPDPDAVYLRAFAEVCERALDYVKFHIAKSPAEQLFCLSDAQIQKIATSFQKDKQECV